MAKKKKHDLNTKKDSLKNALECLEEFSKIKNKPKDNDGKDSNKSSKVIKNEKKLTKKSKNLIEDLALNEVNSNGNIRSYTEEGWKIYTEEELKLGLSKNTNLCPFDCDCCF